MAENGKDFRAELVTNDLVSGPESRILIVTGPNQGGKTTYVQAIGLIQVLAQAGLFVPGTEALLSPVENIFTHFPVEEQPETDAGRFGEEAKRLSEIFSSVTPYSLILLNESLSNTSPAESLALARDLIRVMCLLGARAVFATHLHELAAHLDTLNRASGGDSQAVSVVSQIIPISEKTDIAKGLRVVRTFKIIQSPPTGLSYAGEIASCYGLGYKQLVKVLRSRGLMPWAS
ncbi:MAG TPA: hypothetical protein VMX75_05025 [Spirochaetia bacterium]|nr:hypothetical protein [Spirochaetia bacterium]